MAANENRLFTLDIASEERQRRFIPQRYGGNYSLLVLCLLVIFLGAAMLAWRDTTEFVDRAVAVFFYLTLLVGFRGTTRNPERNAIASLIVLAAVVFDILATLLDSIVVDQINIAIRALLVMYLMISVATDVVSDRRVTWDTIMGSVAAYVLYALFWAVVYTMFERQDPTAFDIPNSSGSPFADLLYFSTVTQTTLGYGDILPIDPLARQCAGLQAMTGQLYVAILVAMLVGIAASQFLERWSRETDS